ncbi:hypothetical protein CC78DRAFT_531297 [Lojkania enalia]|uniref:Uncharacterized protein n=1 Tax=Lojkania enalia TaxID=147567 RepID=A0A9P4KET8_9PLEO|nr:hypothetical protein CC78DRAFT_531297 [Didymosphaeria enalia]
MTLVFGTSSAGNRGALQQIQLGINELASAFVIGKSIGSVVSRDSDATIFRILEDDFGVRVHSIPVWLENFRFPRRGTVYGQGMSRHDCQGLMQGIKVRSLQGVASIIVLCCRFSESVDRITTILELVISHGDNSSVISPGILGEPASRMAYSMKELLSNFVRATIDSDADSEQALDALKWMAKFAIDVGISKRRRLSVGRVQEHNLNLVTKLISTIKGVNEASDEGDNLPRESGQLVHDTLSIGAVSIALAARANSASVTLQCVTAKGVKDIPDLLDQSSFVVRLWLCQPPPQISNILKWGEAEFDAGRSDAEDGDRGSHPVIFGGQLEVACTVAGQIKEEFPNVPFEDDGRVVEMWAKGVEVGRSLQWMVCHPKGTNARRDPFAKRHIRPARFELNLNASDCFKDVPPQVDRLAVSFSKSDARLKALSRVIAEIVHNVFHYIDYLQDEDVDFGAAMTFVTVAIAVGCLHSITKAEAGHDDSYALELGAVCRGGSLRELVARAIHGEGLGHEDLLWAGATLWGGASLASHGHVMVDQRVIGMVSPHCTIILDILRDPKGFAKRGCQGHLIFMCHGSVPLLPRHAKTGFITAADVNPSRHSLDRNDGSIDYGSLSGVLSSLKPMADELELVLTLEPETRSGASQSLFCVWYAGDLAFELDPLVVFHNLLARPDHPNNCLRHYTQHMTLGPYIPIDKIQLLEISYFKVENSYAVFNAHGDSAWLLVAAGCAPMGQVIISRGSLDVISCDHTVGDTILYLGENC